MDKLERKQFVIDKYFIDSPENKIGEKISSNELITYRQRKIGKRGSSDIVSTVLVYESRNKYEMKIVFASQFGMVTYSVGGIYETIEHATNVAQETIKWFTTGVDEKYIRHWPKYFMTKYGYGCNVINHVGKMVSLY